MSAYSGTSASPWSPTVPCMMLPSPLSSIYQPNQYTHTGKRRVRSTIMLMVHTLLVFDSAVDIDSISCTGCNLHLRITIFGAYTRIRATRCGCGGDDPCRWEAIQTPRTRDLFENIRRKIWYLGLTLGLVLVEMQSIPYGLSCDCIQHHIFSVLFDIIPISINPNAVTMLLLSRWDKPSPIFDLTNLLPRWRNLSSGYFKFCYGTVVYAVPDFLWDYKLRALRAPYFLAPSILDLVPFPVRMQGQHTVVSYFILSQDGKCAIAIAMSTVALAVNPLHRLSGGSPASCVPRGKAILECTVRSYDAVIKCIGS
jgi:hypothetical protein